MLATALPAVCAPRSVQLSGKVIDLESKPVEFATVRIAGTAVGTSTDTEGAYRLSVPWSDTIRVVFSCIGYREVRRTLVEPAAEVSLTVRLEPAARDLDEVELVEVRKQTDAMQHIDASAYRVGAADATGGSIESMLGTMAGVSSGNEMSSQYSVRGGSYDENCVYINGVEVRRPLLISSGQQEGLSAINPDMVDAVAFSTGGFGAEYGDRMSSALDITYRRPQSLEGSAALSFMGASAALGQSAGRFSQLHGIRFKRATSLLSTMDTKGEYDPVIVDYQTHLTLKASKSFEIGFLGNIASNRYRFVPVNRTTRFGTVDNAKQFKVYFDGQEQDRFDTWFGALSATWKHGRTVLEAGLSGHISDELVGYDISGEYWLDQAGAGDGSDGSASIGGELGVGRYHEHARDRLKATVITGSLRGSTRLTQANTLTYGWELSSERISERAREWELRDSAGFSLPADGETLRMIYSLTSNQDIHTTRTAFYIQDRHRIQTAAGYWNIQGGLRASWWDWNKQLLLSPRASVGLVPASAPQWSLRAAAGIYYQAPFYKEFRRQVDDGLGNAVVQLNRDIKAQRSVQFIAGADYTFRSLGRPFKLTAEAYYKALSDLVPYEYDNLKVTYSGVNSGSGHVAGVDFKLFGQFVPGNDSWISLSLMQARETVNGVTVPRPNDRRYTLSIYFTDYFPKWPRLKFSLRGVLSDGLPTVAPRTTRADGWFRTPPYKRVDIGLMYGLLLPPAQGERRSGLARHVKAVWLGVDVFNLLDISNVSSFYWVTDVNGLQYAVPNYLTRRQLNLRLSVEF